MSKPVTEVLLLFKAMQGEKMLKKASIFRLTLLLCLLLSQGHSKTTTTTSSTVASGLAAPGELESSGYRDSPGPDDPNRPTVPHKNVLLIVGDDAGFETSAYGNDKCKTPFLNEFSKKAVVFRNAFASSSSCSPSLAATLTGIPQHQNGMYGLHHAYHNFQTFPGVHSLPLILNQTGKFWTGIIGKKHIGPSSVFPFSFSHTEEDYPINQVGRNITLIRGLVREFFHHAKQESPFFLYIGLHDPHRCGHDSPQFGLFCERFGDGSDEMGYISDWHPIDYAPDDVFVPYFVQDTPAARIDLAAQYRTISRMDQGIGLILKELKEAGFEENTLVIYTSDNGIPYPGGHTNLYDPGIAVPIIISNPMATKRWGQSTDVLVSLMDIVPTILDWYGLPLPTYPLFGPNPITLKGRSLLPILEKEPGPKEDWDLVFASQNLHEVTMYYPMRAVRNRDFKLIHNINYKMPFMVDQDTYLAPSFQDLLNRTVQGRPTSWYKTLREYYYRDEWELYDLTRDPQEIRNLVDTPIYLRTLAELKEKLFAWQRETNDPWLCAPNSVWENQGHFPPQGVCLPLDNGI